MEWHGGVGGAGGGGGRRGGNNILETTVKLNYLNCYVLAYSC